MTQTTQNERQRKRQTASTKTPPVQVQEDQYNYDDTNIYRGQPRECRPYRGQNTGQFLRSKFMW